MKETKNCIICGDEAELWCGYVLDKKGIKIMAGWCREHKPSKFNGYSGKWEKGMGKQKALG